MDANESHLNLPERIHMQWSDGILGRMENPFFKDPGIAYPKGYDKNGPLIQFKAEGGATLRIRSESEAPLNIVNSYTNPWVPVSGKPNIFPPLKRYEPIEFKLGPDENPITDAFYAEHPKGGLNAVIKFFQKLYGK